MPTKTIRELFDAALQLPIDTRAGWLAAQALEPQILARVMQLLAAEHDSSSVLDRPFVEQLHGLAQPQETFATAKLIDTHIDGYRLLSLLGQGGMAQVFAAERLDADFHQQVAVKLLRRHLHSELELRLFQRERQALASLEHPNIARLLDGGVTAAGVPYLVMELVRGVDLIQYARQHNLSLRARLALFAQVCDGVNAAHRALIVHRDIKPANILVNQTGVVKLLDFGVAKLLDEQIDQQMATFAPLTPEYAAPEQFDGRAITTATDVFGLGVVLHELLVGVRPARGNGLGTDTARASDLISTQTTLELKPAPISAPELKRFLRGDIDNILRQALAAEPNARYASAGDLAADLRRFLTGQPVQAHPASGWYRTSKFVRRNRGAVLTCGVLLLGLVGSLIYALSQAQIARAQTAQATLQAKRAQATRDFLVQLFEVSEAGVARTEIPSTDTLLRDGGKRVLHGLQDAPNLRIELLNVIGGVQQSLGLSSDAKPLLDAALMQAKLRLSPADPQWLQAHTNSAQLAVDENRFNPAIETITAALLQSQDKNPDMRIRLGALKTLALAQSFSDQFKAAELTTQQMQALAKTTFGAASIESYDALELATEIAYQATNFAQNDLLSTQLLAQANARFGALHARTLEAKIARIQFFSAALRPSDARVLAESAATDLAKVYPQPNETHIIVLNALSAVQFQTGDIDASANTLEQVNQLYLGPLKGHPGRDTLLNNLGAIRLKQLRFEEALALNTQALALASASFGAEHSQTAPILRSRGQILTQLQRFPEAMTALLKAQQIYLAIDGLDSPLALKIELPIADIALRQGYGAKALQSIRPALVRLRQTNAETHRDVLAARLLKARALVLTKNYADAANNLPALLADIRNAGAVATYLLPNALMAQGDALRGIGNNAAARTAYQDALTLRHAEKPVNQAAIAELDQRLRGLQ